MLLKLILILPVIISVSCRENGDYFPEEFIPKVFQVNIQATSSAERKTTLGKEYYDGINEQGTLIAWSEDGKTQTTFKKQSDGQLEYFTVTDDVKCTDQISEINSGWFVNGREILTTSHYFNYLKKNLKLKSKNEMHMGIVAETYAGVIRLGQTDADIEIMWSVPESNWQFPNCPDINNCAKWWVPLKTVLEIPRPDNTTLQLTYVYYDYKTKIDDPEIFQLPRGVACQFLKQTLPFPTNLPIHFEAGVEIYFPFSESQITAKERIYYNMDRKIIRVDLDLPSDLTESKDVGLDREIWDYNTQVIYKMHVKNGSCTVEKMSQDDVAMGVKKKTSVGILNSLMSENVDPTSFFYIGKRLYRSMLCDVWIANLTETPTEIYMFNETAKNEDGIQLKYSVPLFLNLSQSSDIAGEMEIQTSGMSIFNYDLNVPNWSRFDTTSCFIEDNKIRFQILLKGQYTGVIDENPNDFILQIQKQLASQTKILPNRFQEIMIDNFQAPNETSTILFTTTLVENPFNAGHIGTNTYDEKNNPKVYENLTETIYTKKLTFIFKTAGKSYSYRAVEIRDDVVSIPTTSLKDDIKESFQKKAAAVITKGFDFSTSGISRMECFENCVDSIEFDCRSWSFCKDTGGCILSSVLAEHGKDEEFEYKEHTNCEFYTRNFLKDYVLNRDTVTEAFGIEIGVTLEPNTEEECAKQCSTDKLSFYCEGFDSCTDPNSGKKTCYFRTRHILEMEPTSIKKSETCHHYTRDYLGDFLKIKDKSAAFRDFDVHVAAASDVKDCARMCSTSADVNACKAFEMCSPGGVVDKPRTQCRILDSSKEATKKVYPDASCDHYTRNNFINRNKSLNPDDRKTTVSPPVSPAALKSKTLYTGAEMFGLAIGMILLGLLIGGIIVVVVMKYKVMQR